MLLIDADGLIRYASAAHRTVLGYPPEEMVGRTRFDILPPDEVPRMRAVLAQVLNEGGTHRIDVKMRHNHGGERHFELYLHNHLDDPAVRGIVINARDITERRAAEAALRASEMRFRLAFDEAPIGIALTAIDGGLLEVNQALCRMLGYSEHELLEQARVALIHPDDQEDSREQLRLLLAGEIQTSVQEKRYLHKQGQVI